MCAFVLWGPWVFYMCDVRWDSHEKVEKRGVAFLPSFQESLFLS